jgi:hypothetical protein
MHRSARRAGYPSDSSRAARQQTRTRQRAEARCTTTTPSIDSVTSVTVPGRSAAGRCRPCARPGAGPGEKPPPPLPAAGASFGAVHNRHRHRAAAAAPAAVPRSGRRNPGRGPASATAPGRRCEPGTVPPGPCPGGAPWATNFVARCGLPGRHPGFTGGRIAGLLSPSRGRAPRART